MSSRVRGKTGGRELRDAAARNRWPVFAAVALGVCGVAALAALRFGSRPLPDLGAVPSFSLRDHEDQAVADTDFEGRVWVVDFIFTRCPQVCPRLTRTMKEVVRRTESWGRAIAFLSITVDPEFDTPEVLAAYRDAQEVRALRWKFLTGEPAAVDAVVTGFSSYRQPSESGDPTELGHGTHFVLVDGTGHIRGYYDVTTEAGVGRLLAHARGLIGEGRPR